MIGLHPDKVVVVKYDKSWAEEYLKEEKLLKELLKEVNCKIEHVGSTSIPGLSAKPIIDIAVGTFSQDDIFEVAKILGNAGYDMLDEFEQKGEILARKGSKEHRTHYIHIQQVGSSYWNDFVYFKKYMLDNPEAVKEYEILKCELAEKYSNDRKLYTKSKHEFISNILEKSFKIYNL